MRIQLSEINSKKKIFDTTYQADFTPSTAVTQTVISQKKTIGSELEYHEILLDGIHIGYGNTHVDGIRNFHYESTVENIEMHFTLKGKSRSFENTADKQMYFDVHSNQHNIIYSKEIDHILEYEGPEYRFFEVKISPSRFLNQISADSYILNLFQNIIYSGNFYLFQKENRHITIPMMNVIHEIINCKHEGIFKKMFLEAKVLELMMLQLEQLLAIRKEPISRKNLDQVYAIRDFLSNNLTTSHSLVDLAHMVGTNEFSLKRNFKQTFGTTVFGYWHDLKMEEAKRLLIESDFNINEISEVVGYVNARHFSTAFKKKFGSSPSLFKSNFN